MTVHVGQGLGSGFAVEVGSLPSGYSTAIITAEHVIDEATFQGGPKVFVSQGVNQDPARLLDFDMHYDLALLATTLPVPPLPWASDNGHDPAEGEAAIALGSPFGLEGTTTDGIVSNLSDPTFIVTDAAINSGNSGGPLLNRFGEVLGVNVQRIDPQLGDGGFAVRIDRACLGILSC